MQQQITKKAIQKKLREKRQGELQRYADMKSGKTDAICLEIESQVVIAVDSDTQEPTSTNTSVARPPAAKRAAAKREAAKRAAAKRKAPSKMNAAKCDTITQKDVPNETDPIQRKRLYCKTTIQAATEGCYRIRGT